LGYESHLKQIREGKDHTNNFISFKAKIEQFRAEAGK